MCARWRIVDLFPGVTPVVVGGSDGLEGAEPLFAPFHISRKDPGIGIARQGRTVSTANRVGFRSLYGGGLKAARVMAAK